MEGTEYIIYKGKEFTVEWYYDARGFSDVKSYFDDLTSGDQIKLLKLIQRIGDFGKIHDKTKFNNEGDKLYAFKPMPHRFLSCFAIGKKVIVLSAFWKKTRKLPSGEKDRALKLKADYEKRVKEKKYYDQWE